MSLIKWYSFELNAATMLGQAKNVMQAEIDSAVELIDFWRFNVSYAKGEFASPHQFFVV